MTEDLVTESLLLAAEQDIDITPLIYDRFFAYSPESHALMAHVDETALGKMMEEVFRLVMVEDYAPEAGYLTWEVNNHEVAYSVDPDMYEPLFRALIETIRESLGDRWSPEIEQAWLTRTAELQGQIVGRFEQQPA